MVSVYGCKSVVLNHYSSSQFRGRIWALIFMLMMFLPYIGGSLFRPDNLLLVFLMMLYPVLVAYEKTQIVKVYLIVALIPFGYLTIRLLIDMDSGQSLWMARLLNQYSMLCSGGLLYVVLSRMRIQLATFGWAALLFSVPISSFAIYQFVFPESDTVTFIADIYGRKREFPGLEGQVTMIQYALMNKRSSSIFVQPSSLGMYCLLIIAVSYVMMGALSDRYLPGLSMLLALAAGAVSATKVFLLGLVLFALSMFISSLFYGVFKPRRFLGQMMLSIPLALAIVLSLGFYYIDQLLYAISSGGLLDAIFGTRFGSSGYLENSLGKVLTWEGLSFGLGLDSSFEEYADSMPFMALMLGGVPFLIMFYTPPLMLLYFLLKVRIPMDIKRPFLALHIVYLFASMGFPVYIQNRIVPIFIVFSLYVINSLAGQDGVVQKYITGKKGKEGAEIDGAVFNKHMVFKV